MSFVGSYDFFYLPMDVQNRSNVGYAFINFMTPPAAERFHGIFKEHAFRKHQSRKISSVCAAHVQGLDANLRHFETKAVTHSRNDQYRPIVLRSNERISFEEALAEAKARAEVPSALAHDQNLAPAVQGYCPPSPHLGSIPGQVLPSGLHPPADGRRGLEMAVCEYLASCQTTNPMAAAMAPAPVGPLAVGELAPGPAAHTMAVGGGKACSKGCGKGGGKGSHGGHSGYGNHGSHGAMPGARGPPGRQSSAPAAFHGTADGGVNGTEVGMVMGGSPTVASNRHTKGRKGVTQSLTPRNSPGDAFQASTGLGSAVTSSRERSASWSNFIAPAPPVDCPAYVPLPTIHSSSKLFQEFMEQELDDSFDHGCSETRPPTRATTYSGGSSQSNGSQG